MGSGEGFCSSVPVHLHPCPQQSDAGQATSLTTLDSFVFICSKSEEQNPARMSSCKKTKSVDCVWNPGKSSSVSRFFWSWRLPWRFVVRVCFKRQWNLKEFIYSCECVLTWPSPCRWHPRPVLRPAEALWIWRLPAREQLPVPGGLCGQGEAVPGDHLSPPGLQNQISRELFPAEGKSRVCIHQ